MTNNNLILFIALAIAFLFIAQSGDLGIFSTVSDKGECWTYSFNQDECVVQNVELVEYNNESICPAGYFSTKTECERDAKSTTIEKKTCYKYDSEEGLCVKAGKYTECPSGTYESIDKCKEKAEETPKGILFNPITISVIIILGIIGLIIWGNQ